MAYISRFAAATLSGETELALGTIRVKLVLIVHFLSVCVVSAVASGERIGLSHGCARVAHCVTAWLRNFSHYVSMTSDLRVPITEKH